MAVEIERKFLVRGAPPRESKGTAITQAYLNQDPERTIRVRISDDKAFLTIKGRTTGLRRAEYEYEIPVADAREMLALSVGDVVEKTRFHVPVDPWVWEIDVFHGANEGLVVAEIELNDEADRFEKPDWVGEEVSEDLRYLNACLAQTPFSQW